MKKILLFSILTLLTVLVASAAITYSRELEERAILGDNVAMWQLSQCYRFSFGVAQNLDKADYWLDRAAEEGNVEALNQKVLLDDKGKRLSESKRRELAAVERRERERLQAKAEGPSGSSQGSNRTFTVGGVSFTMVAVQGGTFTMGATSEQGSDAYDHEKPAHQVTVSSFSIGETEVTQELWEAVMGSNPSGFKGANRPVEQVSWDDCQEFIRKLNAKTGKDFRLPTEAEWEFAARGGNLSKEYKYSGSDNLDDVAWSGENSGSTTHNVGTKRANELGLYDMSGNVWEWCQDNGYNYDGSATQYGSLRVLRGGGGDYVARFCRVSYRNGQSADYRCNSLGLRLALSEPKAETQPKPRVEPKEPTLSNQTFTVDGVQFTMVAVQGGTFTMGATSEQGSDAHDFEKPPHNVTLSSYYIGETEVTQELWKAVMGSNPSDLKGANRPVEKVSWDECQKFITKLNEMTGKHFRLPTEAEWEFAARGGNLSKGYKYSGSDNLDDVAWSSENFGYRFPNVGTKRANELGLYDMSGSVWEWCSDLFDIYSNIAQTNPTGPSSGFCRVMRGGSVDSNATTCYRVSFRMYYPPDACDNFIGLRLAL